MRSISEAVRIGKKAKVCVIQKYEGIKFVVKSSILMCKVFYTGRRTGKWY